MRYVVYGVDAVSQAPCAPLTVDAHSEEEARDRAVARGMAVRAVMADAAAEPVVEEPRSRPEDEAATEPNTTHGAPPTARMVLLPLAIAFFLILALVRSAVQALTWSCVWGLGLLLGGGVAGLLRWFSRGALPVQTCWPIGVALGVTIVSAMHGWRAGWRWWQARRSLGPLAQALGIAPEHEADEAPIAWRVPVVLAQGLAGALLGILGSLVGWAADWSLPTVVGWLLAGALGLGTEGMILGAVVARRRPMPVPGTVADPSYDSLTWLLGRTGIRLIGVGNPFVGCALDRAVPGAVAGTAVGVAACVLTRLL
jgi:hypothetical protein